MPDPLRILIGCEISGVMRRAFAARGHDVWSCDLEPSEDGSNRHIIGDVRDLLREGWDLLAVMHPPCTRLCNSGVRWLSEPPTKAPDAATEMEKLAWPTMSREWRFAVMWRLLDEGAELFAACWHAPIDRVVVENPIMHKYARERIPGLIAPQIVQPWWFGDPAFKATGFYLRNLQRLVATNRLTPPKKAAEPERHAAWSAIHRASPSPDRARLRSRTFQGIAEAAADQWGGYAAREVAA